MNLSGNNESLTTPILNNAEMNDTGIEGFGATSSENTPTPEQNTGEYSMKRTRANEGASNNSKRKRNRVPLSCTICRKRKVKCDKGRPHCVQCTKTGVAHLCHYMEQVWAEEAQKEISQTTELKQLRNKVKHLEGLLSSKIDRELFPKDHTRSSESTSSVDSPANPSYFDVPRISSNTVFSEYDEDTLDLTREFDMLHLKKNNGLVHLGPTHWLAVMKGDPYLNLLWSHIFTMREKIVLWYKSSDRSRVNGRQPSIDSKCPIAKSKGSTSFDDTLFQSSKAGPAENSIKTEGRCPIVHRGPGNTTKGSLRQCPVSHTRTPMSPTLMKKCPVDHSAFKSTTNTNPPPSNSNMEESYIKSDTISPNIAGCPVMHPKTTDTTDPGNTENVSDNKKVLLPSFNKLSDRCSSEYTSIPTSSTSGHKPLMYKSSMQALQRLRELLPAKNILDLMMERFFKFVYPLIPIVDEQQVKYKINQIFPSTSKYDSLINIKLNKQNDYFHLGIIIILLRLTWLSLPDNNMKIMFDEVVKTQSDTKTDIISQQANLGQPDILLDHEVTVEALEIVKNHLINFDEIASISRSNINITTIQFAILFKYYQTCCSDNGNNSKSYTSNDDEMNQGILSSIVEIAFGCGLHRDPDNFPQLDSIVPSSFETDGDNGDNKAQEVQDLHSDDKVERFKHIWRKLWFMIVSMDVQQSLSLGAPRLLRTLGEISDTKLPMTSKIDLNKNLKEKMVVENFSLFYLIDVCISAVLDHILNLSIAKSMKKKHIDLLIASLKDLTHNRKHITDVVKDLLKFGFLKRSDIISDYEEHFEKSKDYPVANFISLEDLLDDISHDKKNKISKRKATKGSPSSDYGISPVESNIKALAFSRHLTIRALIYFLNYVLFTKYEPLGNKNPNNLNVARYYAQETLHYANDGLENCLFFFKSTSSSGSIFKFSYAILFPECVYVAHRSIQFFLCLILRIKCSSLAGSNDWPILSCSSENNTSADEDSKKTDLRREDLKLDTPIELKFEDPDLLYKTLLSKINIFYDLLGQLSVRYGSTRRILRSTGFFLTLLNEKAPQRYGNKTYPQIPSLANFFKHDPSVFLSHNPDMLKRCPVYQDTIAFIPKLNDQTGSDHATKNGKIQLPPIRSYVPVTYSDSQFKYSNKVRETPTVLSNRDITSADTSKETPMPTTTKPIDDLKSNVLGNSLGLTGIQMETQIYSSDNQPNPQYNDHSTSSLSQDNNGVNNNQELENLLMANTDFNGLTLNPTSILEAFGFDNQIDLNAELNNDFLPIDGMGLETNVKTEENAVSNGHFWDFM